ncbi:uroporphyrinogen-III C-methyltransferase [Chitinophaga lutea]
MCLFEPKNRVTFAGAGPGDPGLITLKALQALGKADAVLYDALVNPALLDLAPAAAIKTYVGKRYGCQAYSQEEINRLMVVYAQQYGHVVRLKGGDPFIFGRIAEEMEALAEAGIPYYIIPGISSALAVPATMGVPLTCRGTAESLWITTGTTRSGEISHDLYLAAQSTATIVILMAMSRLAAIMEIFVAAGRAEMPVAVIQHGTLPEERMVVATVETIAALAEKEGIANPAVIVVGETVRFPGRLRAIAGEVYTKQSSVI